MAERGPAVSIDVLVLVYDSDHVRAAERLPVACAPDAWRTPGFRPELCVRIKSQTSL
jgi:hypothetical protein